MAAGASNKPPSRGDREALMVKASLPGNDI
jgi:hypothetical protein